MKKRPMNGTYEWKEKYTWKCMILQNIEKDLQIQTVNWKETYEWDEWEEMYTLVE